MMKFLANSGLPGVLMCLCALSLTVSAPSAADDAQFPKPLPGQLIQQGRVATVRP